MSPCGPERPVGATRNFAHRLCRNAARGVRLSPKVCGELKPHRL
ncbi:hypothetical protein [Azospirillum palustre]